MAKRTYLRWPNNLLLRLTFMPPGPLTSGCVEYTGALDSDGYGRQITRGSTADRAQPHVAAYELLVGPVPDGHELDHLCRNRACVHPGHLEVVTHAENMRRAALAVTHCKWGHERTPENTYTSNYDGGTRCRLCRVIRQRHTRQQQGVRVR